MREFDYFIKKGDVSLKALPVAKARQLNHHTSTLLEDNTYDASAIHVSTNDLLTLSQPTIFAKIS